MQCTRSFSQRRNLLTHVRIAHQLSEADAAAAISRAESLRAAAAAAEAAAAAPLPPEQHRRRTAALCSLPPRVGNE